MFELDVERRPQPFHVPPGRYTDVGRSRRAECFSHLPKDPMRHPDVRRVARLLVALAIVAIPGTARAQDPPPAEPDARPTGLPSKISWTFNFDAAWGNFGFQNSFFANPKESVQENLSDQWFEGSVKPALSGSYAGRRGELFGKVSAVGERTYGSAPLVAGGDFSSFQVEDLSVGWRSGTTLESLGENAVELIVGRRSTNSGMASCSPTAAPREARAAATGATRARRSSLPRSAASRPVLTRRRSSTWTRTSCPRATRAAGSGARITSSVSPRTPPLVRPT